MIREAVLYGINETKLKFLEDKVILIEILV